MSELVDMASTGSTTANTNNNESYPYEGDNKSSNLMQEPDVSTVNSEEAQNSPAVDVTRVYFNELGKSKLLTADEEKIYGKRVLRGDEEARKIMIESNLRLVVKFLVDI